MQSHLDAVTFAAMVEFLKDFLRCDRYAVLSSSKLPINDKIKRRAQAENSAALALRRSLRAQTAMAQTANVPKASMIDLTKQKKKGSEEKASISQKQWTTCRILNTNKIWKKFGLKFFYPNAQLLKEILTK